jgi:S-adenosylmethionine-dependent methyltransferase
MHSCAARLAATEAQAVGPLLQSAEEELTMSDDVSDIADYYDANVNEEHGRLEHHQLEFDLTWRFLEQYLPPQGRILEIGSATGRYTLALAKRGYELTCVDLSPALLEACRSNLQAASLAHRVRLAVADARHLAAVTETSFDAVLLMGPLYHLIVEADRRQAVQEAVERLCDGGLLVSSFISRFGILADLLKDRPDWINNQTEVASVLRAGKRPDAQPRGGFRGYLARPAEVAPFHEALGLQTLVVAGVEPCIGADDTSYNRLSAPQCEKWLDLLYEVSTERSIIGASRHLLYIGRK